MRRFLHQVSFGMAAGTTVGVLGGVTFGYAGPWLLLGLLLTIPAAVVLLRTWPEPARLVAAPSPPAREARWPSGAAEGCCPVCGMDDPERFRLGVGVTRWRGWAVHDSCAEWLAGGPARVGAGAARCSPLR